MQTHVRRNAVAAGIAAALLLIAPGARAHDDRHQHARARHGHEHALHRHHAHQGPQWLRPDRHLQPRAAERRVRWQHAAERRGTGMTARTPYYCFACGKRYKQEKRFHQHLREQHRLMHQIRWHLVRWYGGWAYFG